MVLDDQLVDALFSSRFVSFQMNARVGHTNNERSTVNFGYDPAFIGWDGFPVDVMHARGYL